MNQVTGSLQNIAALGSIVLLSGALVLLMVQYLKDLTGLDGSTKRGKVGIQLLALGVGALWGLVTMRTPAALIWPDIAPALGGGIIGALSGIAAIGTKSFTNGAIDRNADATARARAETPPAWLDLFRQGQGLSQGRGGVDQTLTPGLGQSYTPQREGLGPGGYNSPTPGASWPSQEDLGGSELTPVQVRPLPSIPGGQDPLSNPNLTGVPID